MPWPLILHYCKVGGGVYLNIQLVSTILPIIQSHVTHEVDNTFMRTAVAFNQEECHIMQEISSACVNAKLKGK